MNKSMPVVQNAQHEIEHVFIYNHTDWDFDTFVIPANNKQQVATLKMRADLNSYRNLILYGCMITEEEAKALNEQMNNDPLKVLDQLSVKMYKKTSL